MSEKAMSLIALVAFITLGICWMIGFAVLFDVLLTKKREAPVSDTERRSRELKLPMKKWQRS